MARPAPALRARCLPNGYVSPRGLLGSADPQLDGHFRFMIYREEPVQVTSVLFTGGAWRWRLCSADGAILAKSVGYRTYEECRAALASVCKHADSAILVS